MKKTLYSILMILNIIGSTTTALAWTGGWISAGERPSPDIPYTRIPNEYVITCQDVGNKELIRVYPKNLALPNSEETVIDISGFLNGKTGSYQVYKDQERSENSTLIYTARTSYNSADKIQLQVEETVLTLTKKAQGVLSVTAAFGSTREIPVLCTSRLY